MPRWCHHHDGVSACYCRSLVLSNLWRWVEPMALKNPSQRRRTCPPRWQDTQQQGRRYKCDSYFNHISTATSNQCLLRPQVWKYQTGHCFIIWIFSRHHKLNFLNTFPIKTTTMLRLVAFVTLAIVGINAELLRGKSSAEHHSREQIRELISPTGTCLCTILCQQCEIQDTDMLPCQSVCDYAYEPDCFQLCSDFLTGSVNRDDANSNPPLPSDGSTQTPAASPSVPCRCIAACDSCKANGSNTAPCETVCKYANLPNDECTIECNFLP